jgi:hypothetical protein
MRRVISGWCGRVMIPLLLTLGACAPGPNDLAASSPVARQAAGNSVAADRYLAVTHSFTLRAPSAETEAIQQKHMAECIKLVCTIVSTSIDRSNQGRINARAAVRIKPESYDAFAAALAAPPAQITIHSQSAEDLGLTIIDTEKRLEAKTLFRDRLTAMLRDQSVKTGAELIAIEKELAQTQGDIETIVAQRDSLRTRTETVRVDIFYVGTAGQVGGIDLTPIHQAVSGIGQTFVGSVSWLISTFAAAAPWIPIIWFGWWAVSRTFRRWRVRRA